MITRFFLILLTLALFGSDAISGEKSEAAVLSYQRDNVAREGIIAELTTDGKILLDDGKLISSLAELEVFMRSIDWQNMSPRLIVKSNAASAEYYHMATEALLLFQKYCPSYSLVVIK